MRWLVEIEREVNDPVELVKHILESKRIPFQSVTASIDSEDKDLSHFIRIVFPAIPEHAGYAKSALQALNSSRSIVSITPEPEAVL